MTGIQLSFKNSRDGGPANGTIQSPADVWSAKAQSVAGGHQTVFMEGVVNKASTSAK